MLETKDGIPSLEWIASQIPPRITTEEARIAVATLERLGLLVRGENGGLLRGEPSLTTGHEVRSVVVPAYHRQMIERAGAAVDFGAPEERDIRALTVCVRTGSLVALEDRIHRFRGDARALRHRERARARL